MESLKVLQIPVKEWILVVPLNFKSYRSQVHSAHVVDLMRSGRPFLIIDDLADHDVAFAPPLLGQCSPETLGRLRFPATTANQLDIRDLHIRRCPT